MAVAKGSVASFDMGAYGNYVLNLGMLNTKQKFVMPEFEISLVDWIVGLIEGTASFMDILPVGDNAEAWVNSSSMFTDPYTSFSSNMLLDPLAAWTGTQQIWNWSISGTL
jgi:hypothetical protein